MTMIILMMIIMIVIIIAIMIMKIKIILIIITIVIIINGPFEPGHFSTGSTTNTIYHITWDVQQNYLISVNNKRKFRIVGLGGRLVNFEAKHVEDKFPWLRVSQRNACFCSRVPLVKFV